MRKHFRNVLLIGSLLLSSTASVNAAQNFTDIISGLAPTLPLQDEHHSLYSPREDSTLATASKYLAQRPFDMKMVKKVTGSNQVFTLDALHEATDGAYILLRQSDLKSADSVRALQAVLQKPTDVHVVLDVEADSAGVLNLYSVAKIETSDGSTTLRRVLPYIKHLHLINSAQNVKTIGRSFLCGDKYLEDITFTGFENVEHIADGFMLMCKNLKSADLSSFKSLKTIGGFFMSEAKSLTTLNLHTTRFFNADLTSVGDHFLRGATSLARIQEEALESVAHIGDYFMSESGVAKFNTGKFKKLKELGKGFLSKCSSLAYVNVSGLNRIEPTFVTLSDVEAAKAETEKTRLHAHSMYKEAWVSDTSVQYAQEMAEPAEIALAHKVEMTEKAIAKTKALAAKAQTLKIAVAKGQRHNLGLLYNCATLQQHPEAIRGAWDLLPPLRDQLHVAYPGLTYDDDSCGC